MILADRDLTKLSWPANTGHPVDARTDTEESSRYLIILRTAPFPPGWTAFAGHDT